jgi:hypothetical protein
MVIGPKLVAAVVAALSIGAAFGQATSCEPSDAVRISGRIVNSTGVPIPGQPLNPLSD